MYTIWSLLKYDASMKERVERWSLWFTIDYYKL